MLIYGGGGHSLVLIEACKDLGLSVNGIFDDNPKLKSVDAYPVLGKYNAEFHTDDQVIFGIGDNSTRKKLADTIKHEAGTLIHPSAVVAGNATIGKGVLINYLAAIEAHVRIGDHAIVNTLCSISHESIVEDFVHIAPKATVGAGISIGEGAMIGTHAVILPFLRIGKWATVGAGAVVTKDVPDFAIVAGNPARIMGYNNQD
jgi:sugar O-acyltransferase (sialic acid O-acetyltransferase NeuD family)